MQSIALAIRAIRELGLCPTSAFALYEFQKRSGWLRLRTPAMEWDAVGQKSLVVEGVPTNPAAYWMYRLGTGRSFFFDPKIDLSASLYSCLRDQSAVLFAEADEILVGRYRLFGGPPIDYGFPPDWKKAPKFDVRSGTGELPLDVHWTSIDIDNFPLDIKLLWEPARFGWAYVLGRAYRMSGEDKYAAGFWRLLESWRVQNPPNQGPHWTSAQEVAIRLMAITFSLFAFHPYLAKDPQKSLILVEMIAAHANRILPTLLYSRAQGNNHLIIEATGLYTAGLLFPEFKQATQWRRIGRCWLEKALKNQIFVDGGYVQHSANYHRLALEAALWSSRLGQLNGDDFLIWILDALRNAANCLRSLVDATTGKASNFGSNDGAMLLPLTTCDFQDYRPVIQLAFRFLLGETPFPAGPWDEACFWFGLLEDGVTKVSSKKHASLEPYSAPKIERGGDGRNLESRTEASLELSMEKQIFPQAGLYLLRGNQTWGCFRCVKFTQRPGHSDQLNLDLWWKGENIARDAGTYLYNGKPPWENGLAFAKVHNTILVDEKEPMWRASRFLWLKWAQGTVLGYKKSSDGILEFVSGEQDGYKSLGIRVIRSVIRAGDEFWMVVDDVLGNDHHTLRSGWLLPDGSWKVRENSLFLEGSQGRFQVIFSPSSTQWSLHRAGQLVEGEDLTDCAEILGWFSPTYAIKEPGLYYSGYTKGILPLRMISTWCLGDTDPDRLQVYWAASTSGEPFISKIVYGHTLLEF